MNDLNSAGIFYRKLFSCPYYANTFSYAHESKTKGRTGFSVAAGVLTIIAACIGLASGTVWISSLLSAFASNSGNYQAYLLYGILGIFGFVFGLTGAVCSLRRKNFALSIIGMSLVWVTGLITMIGIGTVAGALGIDWIGDLLSGLPITAFSTLALVLASKSKDEFN